MFNTAREEVLLWAEAFAVEHAVTTRQRRLLETAFVGLRREMLDGAALPFVHLPLLVYSALRGDHRPAIPLAGVTTLLFLGLDIFDDLADGDGRTHWKGYRAAEVNLAAATLLSSLPQLAIAGLEAPAAHIAAMQRMLASGLLVMSAGQHDDIAMIDCFAVSVDEVEASVARKSGEELATFSGLAAQLAEAAPDIMNAYSRFARALGTASQLASDCYELFNDPVCRDLVHGTRTLPIALHLDRLPAQDKSEFLALLDRAKHDQFAQETVRNRLRASGAMRLCAFSVELYCQRALRALEEAHARGPAYDGLRAMVNEVSFFPTKPSERVRLQPEDVY